MYKTDRKTMRTFLTFWKHICINKNTYLFGKKKPSECDELLIFPKESCKLNQIPIKCPLKFSGIGQNFTQVYMAKLPFGSIKENENKK